MSLNGTPGVTGVHLRVVIAIVSGSVADHEAGDLQGWPMGHQQQFEEMGYIEKMALEHKSDAWGAPWGCDLSPNPSNWYSSDVKSEMPKETLEVGIGCLALERQRR